MLHTVDVTVRLGVDDMECDRGELPIDAAKHIILDALAAAWGANDPADLGATVVETHELYS